MSKLRKSLLLIILSLVFCFGMAGTAFADNVITQDIEDTSTQVSDTQSENSVASVTYSSGEKKYFDSLSSAWNSAKDSDNSTLIMLKDYQGKCSFSFNTSNKVEFDLNGHTIDMNSSSGFMSMGRKAKLVLTSSTGQGRIINAKTSGRGGVIDSSGQIWCSNISFENCKIQGGIAKNEGGVFAMTCITMFVDPYNPILEINNCQFTDCYAAKNGGVICAHYESSKTSTANTSYLPIKVDNSTFTNCSSGEKGGAIYLENASIDMTSCKASGCKSENGGFIELFDSSYADLTKCDITGCTAKQGSVANVWYGNEGIKTGRCGIYLKSSTITGNTSTNTKGGAIYCQEAPDDKHGFASVSGVTVIKDNYDSKGNASNIVLGYHGGNILEKTQDATISANLEEGAEVHVGSECSSNPHKICSTNYTSNEEALKQASYIKGDWLKNNTDVGARVPDDDKTHIYLGTSQEMKLISFKMTDPRLYGFEQHTTIDYNTHTVTVYFPFQSQNTMEPWQITYDCGSSGYVIRDSKSWTQNPATFSTWTEPTDKEVTDEFTLYHNGAEQTWTVKFVNHDEPLYKVMVDVENGHFLNGSSSGAYSPGETMYVYANEVAGKTWLGWEATGITLTDEQRMQKAVLITVPTNSVKLKACYADNAYTLDVINGTGNGKASQLIEGGRYVALKAEHKTGKIFAYWTYKGPNPFGIIWQRMSPCPGFNMPNGNLTLEAHYIDNPYAYYSLVVSNGTIKDTGETAGIVKAGENQTVVADEETTQNGTIKTFDHWEVTSGDLKLTDEQKTSKTLTFMMPEDNVVLTAVYNYEEIYYPVVVDGGTVDGKTYTELTEGTEATIKADFVAGETFDHWEAYGITLTDDQKKSESFTLTMPDSTVVLSAQYTKAKIEPNNLTVNNGTFVGGETSGSVSTGQVWQGAQVSITANDPEAGYQFLGWQVVSGNLTLTEEQAKSSSITITMPDSDVELKAIYNPLPVSAYSITVTKGTAFVADEAVTYSVEGNEVEAVADSVGGMVFDHWNVEGVNLDADQRASSTVTFTMPNNNVKLEATYITSSIEPYTLYVENGVINQTEGNTCQDFYQSSTVTVNANSVGGMVFAGWECEGMTLTAEQKMNSELTFSMPGNDVNLRATYVSASVLPRTLSVESGSFYGCSDPVSGVVTGNIWAGSTVTVHPDAAPEGATFNHWEATGIELTTEQKNTADLTITMPDNDVALEAVYLYTPIKAHSVLVTNGEVDGKTSNVYFEGTEATVTADAAGGKIFAYWEATGIELTDEQAYATSFTFTMPDNNVTFTAHYLDLSVEPNTLYVENGTANGEQLGSYYAGTHIVAAAMNTGGLLFDHWDAYGITLTSEQMESPVITFDMPDNLVILKACYTNASVESHQAKIVNGVITDTSEYETVGNFYAGTSIDVCAVAPSEITVASTESGAATAQSGASTDATYTMVFDRWEVLSGDLTLTDEQAESEEMTFSMPDTDVVVAALYIPIENPYHVTVTYGQIDDDTEADVYEGDPVSITSLEAEGLTFSHWVATGIELTDEQAKSTTLTFDMPGNDVDVIGIYDIIMPHSVTVTNGTITTDGNTSTSDYLYEGTEFTLKADTYDDKTFAGWKVTGMELRADQLKSAELTLTMPENDVTFEATYTERVIPDDKKIPDTGDSLSVGLIALCVLGAVIGMIGICGYLRRGSD